MNTMSTPVRLLYYLNNSKENKALLNIAADAEALQYYMNVCAMNSGSASAKQMIKKILKIMKEAVK